MSSALSKRQQARNERALQDLIRSVAGNNTCADCQARNPGETPHGPVCITRSYADDEIVGWASWSVSRPREKNSSGSLIFDGSRIDVV
jgi:hypothetical protein